MVTPAYRNGVRTALCKLGFIHLMDPEDLPKILRPAKKRQLYRLYQANQAAGFPAGGRIERPENYDEY